MQVSERLAEYLALETQIIAVDIRDQSFADYLRDNMSIVWCMLSDSEREYLNGRRQVLS